MSWATLTRNSVPDRAVFVCNHVVGEDAMIMIRNVAPRPVYATIRMQDGTVMSHMTGVHLIPNYKRMTPWYGRITLEMSHPLESSAIQWATTWDRVEIPTEPRVKLDNRWHFVNTNGKMVCTQCIDRHTQELLNQDDGFKAREPASEYIGLDNKSCYICGNDIGKC